MAITLEMCVKAFPVGTRSNKDNAPRTENFPNCRLPTHYVLADELFGNFVANTTVTLQFCVINFRMLRCVK